MPQISKEHLDKFKELYKKKTGKDISDQDALESATKLINLVKAVYRPMTKDDYDKVQKRRLETQ
jgi:rubrerythrin